MPDVKLQHANKAALLDLTASVVNPFTSQAMSFRTEQIGASLYTLSTQNGSLQVQVYMGEPSTSETMVEANWQNFGSPRAITANTLDTVTLNGGLPPIRVVFTPSITPYTIKTLVWGFGG